MEDLELIIDLHKNTSRQGPGSEVDTLKALFMTGLQASPNIQIADIGCGNGAQTMTLAKNTLGHISAVDLFPAFLKELEEKAALVNLTDRISTVEASMEDLPFKEDSMDLIWSEGAIYIMGFEKGIQQWKNYLKPGGYLAVSEISWISKERPVEIDQFWTEAYPEIDTVENKIKILESKGYEMAGHFILPASSWIKGYYEPIESSFSSFLDRHKNSSEAQNTVREYQKEIALYKKFQQYYSYGFYVARKKSC